MTKKKTGVDLIAAERLRQIKHGFNANHDDGHKDGALAAAAASLLAQYLDGYAEGRIVLDSSWESEYPWILNLVNKQDSDIQLLTIVGAFAAAEIERLQRLQVLV